MQGYYESSEWMEPAVRACGRYGIATGGPFVPIASSAESRFSVNEAAMASVELGLRAAAVKQLDLIEPVSPGDLGANRPTMLKAPAPSKSIGKGWGDALKALRSGRVRRFPRPGL